MSEFSLPEGKRLALSIVVNVEEGSEMNVVDGDKLPEPVDELGVALKIPIRNYVNESNYQYGIRAGGPRVMKLLEKYAAKTTVTAAAVALERAPQLVAEIKRQGHEVCSHGWRWVHQFSYKEDREREFIRKATNSIESTIGIRPFGWLSRYLHTDQTRRLLLEEGYTYHMDDMSDDIPRWEPIEMADGSTRALVCMPYAIDTNDMKFWVAPAYTPDQWLSYVRRSVDWLLEESKEGPRMLNVGVHLRIIGRPGRIWAFEEFLQYASSIPEIWITSRKEIADRFAQQCPWEGG
ncbi:MAG: allantoinase [Gammaproteobacteria bacterium]|jgi:allantoinase